MIRPEIPQKLRLKSGQHIAVLNAPDQYVADLMVLEPMATITTEITDPPYDVIQLFVRDRQDIELQASVVIKALTHGGILWFTYPKKSGPIKSDLARDTGWEILQSLGWDFVTLISIDETWSAHRYRPHQSKKNASNKVISGE